ncbi:ROK family transcriptional regulator [Microbacterium kribbense]|uniref:ROK family transcriptional regulator n=1 Tax=Microbacterium kribbense TaxID=433645 RepID=A0ABP7GSU7_9MICO
MSTKTLPGTPSWLRQRNERTVLSVLFDHGVLTRNRIGELSGLSKPTASQIVAHLGDVGIIEAVGEVSRGRGPNAATYSVRSDRGLGVAVDIGESEMRSTVVDVNGTEYPIAETVIDASEGDRAAASVVQQAVDAACAAAGKSPSAVRVVSLGIPGSVDPRTDELSFIDALPNWPTKNVRAQLEAELGFEVVIDNDVNLAAIAVRSEGSGAEANSFALLWMGEGLGLAVDLAGAVHRGAAGGAGEIGYLPAPRNAAEIDPDATDLQQLFGQAAILAISRAHGVSGDDRAVLEALTTHPARAAVLTEVARRVAIGVVPVLAILDPELIVLGGPVGAAGGELLAELVSSEVRRTTLWHPRITDSGIAVHPVLRGARIVLVREVRQRLLHELEAKS